MKSANRAIEDGQLQSPGWNEVAFVSWRDFQRMAPPILRLEIRRLSSLIGQVETDLELRNMLVKARYEIKTFCEELADASATTNRLVHRRLDAAILTLSSVQAADGRPGIEYVLDRLKSVRVRLDFIHDH